ncbi:MAG: hypothetical protein DRQ55_16625, partial [Planctomycetota bacterium]
EPEDQQILLLSYGLGLRVGAVSQAVDIDPALVVWRLHRAFARRGHEQRDRPADADLERGLGDLLAGRSSTEHPPLPDSESWSLAALLAALPTAVQQRLVETQSSSPRETLPPPGVGVGLAAIVLTVVLGFLGFGVVRDIDPARRGDALMEQYEYTRARASYRKSGTIESHVRIVLCLLAEGHFDQALEELGDDEVRAWFKRFAPADVSGTQPVPQPSTVLATPDDSRALLPRGLITNRRPAFVLRAGPPGQLVLKLDKRELRMALPDTRGGTDSFVVDYPDDWPSLWPGRVAWRVDDGDDNVAVFDIADEVIVKRVRDRTWRVLTRDIPQRAQLFLRAHHFVSEGMLVQAGVQFARLSETFPAEPYPWQQLQAVAQALGVDPSVLLR